MQYTAKICEVSEAGVCDKKEQGMCGTDGKCIVRSSSKIFSGVSESDACEGYNLTCSAPLPRSDAHELLRRELNGSMSLVGCAVLLCYHQQHRCLQFKPVDDADHVACDDKDGSTDNDVCVGGKCMGTTKVCTPPPCMDNAQPRLDAQYNCVVRSPWPHRIDAACTDMHHIVHHTVRLCGARCALVHAHVSMRVQRARTRACPQQVLVVARSLLSQSFEYQHSHPRPAGDITRLVTGHALMCACAAQPEHSNQASVRVQYVPVANTPAQACDDGDVTTDNEKCFNGACTGTPKVCSPPACMANDNYDAAGNCKVRILRNAFR